MFLQLTPVWRPRLFCLISIVLTASVAIVGCGGGSSSGTAATPAATAPPGPPPSTTTPATAAGPLGVVEDQSAGLSGKDSDANGVRDDVDALIEAKYSATPGMRSAAQQRAKATQALMAATNESEAIAAAEAILRASDCAFQVVGDEAVIMKMSSDLRALTANTTERITAYLDANRLIPSRVFSSSRQGRCD